MNKVVVSFTRVILYLVIVLPTSVLHAEVSLGCLEFQKDLTFGATDYRTEGDVSRLQSFLVSKGYLKSSVTGYFGKSTLQAVQDFQLIKGLRRHSDTDFGRLDTDTRALIKKLTCKQTTLDQNGAATIEKSTLQIVPRPVNGAVAPIISEFSPQQVSAGEQLTINGSGLTNKYSIFFDTVFIETQISSEAEPRSIQFTIPKFLGRPCPENMFCITISEPVRAGVHTVMLQNINGVSNTIEITVKD